jgi:mono/diheme cytochrome c family protein
MRFRFYMVMWIVLGLLLLAVTGCGEMYHQPAVQPQEGTRLAPPTASVPVTGVERTYNGVEGKSLTNPIPKDQASVNQGQSLFNTNCAMCHGQQGKGDGPVASAFIPQPADLTSSEVQSLTDGDIFLVITNGFSTMPSFRKQLVPDERWQIINYVRTFGQRQ